MVKQVKNIAYQYAICIAALLYVILFCTGFISPAKRYHLRALIPHFSITDLKGQIISNPVRMSTGDMYKCVIAVSEVRGDVSGFPAKTYSSAQGRAEIYIPSSIIESQYPGKLYSRYASTDSKTNTTPILAETGAVFNFAVTPLPTAYTGGLPLFTVHNAAYFGFGTSWRDKIRESRAALRLKLKRLLYDWGDAGGLLLALLSGSAEYTDSSIKNAFQKAGLAHILALSGMHLSLFSAVAGRIAGMTCGKKAVSVCALTAAILFVWFAGITPSLLRALICNLLYAVCVLCSLKPDMLKILCTAFFIHVSIDPSSIYSVAFQLSYAALAGILTIGKFSEPLVYRIFPGKISSDLSASVAAQTATAPVTISVFNCITPVGIISSVIVSPFVSLFLTAGLFFVAVAVILSEFSIPLGGIIKLLYTCIVWVVCLFAQIPPLEF